MYCQAIAWKLSIRHNSFEAFPRDIYIIRTPLYNRQLACSQSTSKNADTSIGIRNLIRLYHMSYVHRFSDDIEYMTGSRPNLFWKICWMFVTPAAMMAILIASIILMSQGKASYYAWNMDKVQNQTSLITFIIKGAVTPLFHEANYRPTCLTVCCHSSCKKNCLERHTMDISRSALCGARVARSRINFYYWGSRRGPKFYPNPIFQSFLPKFQYQCPQSHFPSETIGKFQFTFYPFRPITFRNDCGNPAHCFLCVV